MGYSAYAPWRVNNFAANRVARGNNLKGDMFHGPAVALAYSDTFGGSSASTKRVATVRH